MKSPWVAEGGGDILAENMVISVEPGIYLQGLGGFRHSDTVLVTRHGHEALTNCPAEIDSLTIKSLAAGDPPDGVAAEARIAVEQENGGQYSRQMTAPNQGGGLTAPRSVPLATPA